METKWKVALQMQFLDLEVWFCHIREQGKKKTTLLLCPYVSDPSLFPSMADETVPSENRQM